MNKRLLRYLGIATCIAYSTMASNAWAIYCDPPDAANQAGEKTTNTLLTRLADLQTALINRLNTLEQDIVQTLKLETGQITSAIQTSSVASAKVVDAQTQNQAQISRQQDEAKAIVDHRPSGAACQAVTATKSAATSAVVSQRARISLNDNLQQWNAAAPNSASSAGETSSVGALANYRTDLYCPPYKIGNCSKAGTMPDADIKPGNTIYAHSTLPDQSTQQAAADLVRMVTGPIPSAPPPPRNDDPGYLRLFIAWLTKLAEKNVAIDSWNASIADRTPAADSSAFKAILSASNIPTADPLPDKISRKQLFELDVSRRYENPAWQASLGEMNTAEVQRETVRLMALQSEILLRIDDKLERIANTQATLLAHQIDTTPPPARVQ